MSCCRPSKCSCKGSVWTMWPVALLLLVLAGVVYRVLASRLELIVNTPIELPVPLSVFPKQVDGWVGNDVPISENIQRVAKNDDFLNRLYINQSVNKWANVYIAYSARPRTMLGHRPDICYVGGGWVHDSTDESSFVSSAGRNVSCLIHRFHMPAPRDEQVVVLNYYVLNGRITADDSGFSGMDIRTPNISGNPARYVVQVQISSVLENSVLAAAKDFTELILDYLPDENGRVKMIK